MPKIEYVDKKFTAGSLKLIQIANDIITDYRAQGFDLTLRQLYYQFVSRNVIPNKQKEYNRLGSVINDARLAGLIDWNAIVDRTRFLRSNAHWTSPADIIRSSADQYQIDKWEGQEHRVEVWIEKDALIGVIEPICDKLDLPYFSCRGYTSQSEMWQAAQRLIRHSRGTPMAKPVIIHLGDHDPSGKDMSRDIQDRLDLFMEGRAVKHVRVERVALNMNQIEEYNPPPNPAKITDSRARAYIEQYGSESWELDALDPKVIAKLISDTVAQYRDDKLWNKRVRLEKRHKAELDKVAKKLED